ncbi:MAG TPA: hypothetical protein VFJ79_06510 [Acidimicrobiales bacterium]|nr:hypothetical protein [Acidimicrobiales bacterium]
MTAYHVLVMLHLLCVIGGFGALAYNALYMSLAQRRPTGGTGAILEVNTLVSGLAELLIYAALVFGIGAVASSHSTVKFSQAWVSAALGVYIAAVGVLHGWIKRHQRLYASIVAKLESGADPATREKDVAELMGLEKKVGFGWGVFNALVIAAVYLMVFKPGS